MKLERFQSLWRRHLALISVLDAPSESEAECEFRSQALSVFKKLLYLVSLEALAGIRYSENRPQVRVATFVATDIQWEHASRVSLPHLYRVLQIHYKRELESLCRTIERNLSSWRGHCPLSRDPKLSEVREWIEDPTWEKSLPANLRLHKLQHGYLLYRLRSKIVHEFRQQGRGIEMPGITDEPCYQVQQVFEDRDDTDGQTAVELIYPVSFLERLCLEGLDVVVQYCRTRAIDPFSQRYDPGPYWIADLNKGKML